MFLSLSPSAIAKDIPVKPQHLRIYLVPQKINVAKLKKLKKEWAAACEQIGELLKVGQGPWEHGAFTSFSCHFQKRLVGGEKGKKTRWRLELIDNNELSEWQLSYRIAKEEKVLVTKLPMPSVEQTLPLLVERDLAELIAARILVEAPMARPVDLFDSTRLIHIKSNGDNKWLPSPPSTYKIFALKTSDKEFVSKEVGTMELESLPTQQSKAKRRRKKRGQSNGGEWRVEVNDEQLSPRETYWAQDSNAKESRLALDDAMVRAFAEHELNLDSLLQAFRDTFASGYAGMRYGFPLTKGHPLFSKTPLVGIFTEVRGGPLQGLRWYWDFVPKTEAEHEGQVISVKWSRPSLGWSFGKEFDTSFLDRVDLTPKLGLLNLESTLPAVDPITGLLETVEFRSKDAVNVGVELGAEVENAWFLFRLWTSSDMANLRRRNDSVTSYRAGFDTYWDLIDFSDSMKSSLLLFSVIERLNLAKTQEVEEDATLTATGLSFNQAFMGLGFTLAW